MIVNTYSFLKQALVRKFKWFLNLADVCWSDVSPSSYVIRHDLCQWMPDHPSIYRTESRTIRRKNQYSTWNEKLFTLKCRKIHFVEKYYYNSSEFVSMICGRGGAILFHRETQEIRFILWMKRKLIKIMNGRSKHYIWYTCGCEMYEWLLSMRIWREKFQRNKKNLLKWKFLIKTSGIEF